MKFNTKKADGRAYFSDDAFDGQKKINDAIEDTFKLITKLEEVETANDHLTDLKEKFKKEAKATLKKSIFESMSEQIGRFIERQASKKDKPRNIENDNSRPDPIWPLGTPMGNTFIDYTTNLKPGEAKNYKDIVENYDPNLIYGVVSRARDKNHLSAPRIVAVDKDKRQMLLDKASLVNLVNTNPHSRLANESGMLYVDINDEVVTDPSSWQYKMHEHLNIENIKEKLEEIKNRHEKPQAKKKSTKKKTTKKKSVKKAAKKKTSKKKTTKRSKNGRTKKKS